MWPTFVVTLVNLTPWSFTAWDVLCERRSRIETILKGEKIYRSKNKGLRSFTLRKKGVTVFTTLINAHKRLQTYGKERRNGYVLDYRHLLLLLWDVRFNQAVLRPASDRNALPGGNEHQGTAPAEDIFDFSQDPRASRLLPAIDRTFDFDTDNSIDRRLISVSVGNDPFCTSERRIFAEPQTDIELRWVESEQMDGRARWIYSSAQW